MRKRSLIGGFYGASLKLCVSKRSVAATERLQEKWSPVFRPQTRIKAETDRRDATGSLASGLLLLKFIAGRRRTCGIPRRPLGGARMKV